MTNSYAVSSNLSKTFKVRVTALVKSVSRDIYSLRISWYFSLILVVETKPALLGKNAKQYFYFPFANFFRRAWSSVSKTCSRASYSLLNFCWFSALASWLKNLRFSLFFNFGRKFLRIWNESRQWTPVNYPSLLSLRRALATAASSSETTTSLQMPIESKIPLNIW